MKRLSGLVLAALILPACGRSTPPKSTPPAPGGGSTLPQILMFVPASQTWWAEYKVAYEGYRARGYDVDVRSSAVGVATSYQTDGDVQSSAGTLAGSSYGAFQADFATSFGAAWNAVWNAPADIPVAGRIQDVASLAGYVALSIVGGIGAVDYRYDGSYPNAEVQAAAERLNGLINEAVQQGIPVLAECHAAAVPVFARTPGTAGQMPSPDGLGTSLLRNRTATGFPGGDTAAVCASFGVTYLTDRRAVVENVITTRDWYPQTVAHGARTLLAVLGSTPSPALLAAATSVLILHGGPCDPSNPNNDIPANYGTVPASIIPVDYLDLQALLAADSPLDPFTIQVSEVNLLGGAVPFNLASSASALAYFSTFDVVIAFKHWSSQFGDPIQTALRDYADQGGGLVAIHHALFNHDTGAVNRNILCRDVFGAESHSSTWGARNPNNGPYGYMNLNHGHFVSTYGVPFTATSMMPPAGFPASPAAPNPCAGGYPALNLTDEIYTNTTFTGTPVFGDGVGQINLLFANDHTAFPGQVHTAGFTKRFNPSSDASVGRLVYLQPGERVENVQVGHPYGQILRNAVIWAAQGN